MWGDFLRGTAVALLCISTCVLIEHIAPIDRYTLKQRIAGFVMQLGGGWLALLLVTPVQELWDSVGVKPYLIPLWHWLKPLGVTGFIIQVLLVIVIVDFLSYWRHRAEHRWFWPIHVVHHAPTELHAVNDLTHPLAALISFAFITIPMSLISFGGPAVPTVVGVIGMGLGVYIHSPTSAHLGPLWKVVVDPRFHRIHHSLEPRHFDKNFGIMLSVWDSVFGTAYWPQKGEHPKVGVDEYPAPRNFREYLLLPLARIGQREFDDVRMSSQSS